MGKNIPLSPKYGVNPTIPICFMCGKPKNEIALLGRIGDGRKGEDFEAPRYMLLDYNPCDECAAHMRLGVTMLEVQSTPLTPKQPPIQNGLYPTGRWCVLKKEAAARIFGEEKAELSNLLLDRGVYEQLFGRTQA